MTKEELEKEAEEKCAKYKLVEMETYEVEAYIEGAEPREKHIAELEKENAELKTVKIPQLERKIASIRGAHSVDCKKLNARLEQCERQKERIADLEKANEMQALRIKECNELLLELKAQIEKMKCCGNCNHFNFSEPNYCHKGVYRERQYVCSEWEFVN